MRRNAGFTLIEILIAMAIFLFGVSAVLGLFQVGGGYEQEARARAELAPAVEPLVAQLKAEAWQTDQDGGLVLGARQGVTVPGAPDYKYDLEVEESDVPTLRRAVLRFYRRTPERVLASAAFLLPQQIPVSRRVAPNENP